MGSVIVEKFKNKELMDTFKTEVSPRPKEVIIDGILQNEVKSKKGRKKAGENKE
jgi:hypothetical protein